MRKAWVRMGAIALVLVLVFALGVPEAYAKHGKAKKIKNTARIAERMQQSIKEQNQVRFKDMEEAPWAVHHLARLRVKGIIQGDEKGFFNPKGIMTQAEVITMIARALGFEPEAQEMDANFRSLYPWARGGEDFDEEDEEEGSFRRGDVVLPVVPRSASWALGYILYAVDQGWVSPSELQPRKSASRAWTAMVMVRALGYEEEAQASMNATLPFKDANAVPPNMVGYLAVAVDLGLFQGTPDGKLLPMQPISRVEMAALIDKFFEGEPIDLGPYEVKGTVTEVVYDGFTISTSSGKTLSFTFVPDVVVVIGNNPASLEDLKVDQRVHVLANEDGVALFIKICLDEEDDAEEETTLKGSITRIDLEDGEASIIILLESGDTRKLDLDDDVEISYQDTELAPEDLLIGDVVVITLGEDGEVAGIEVLSRGTVAPSSGELSGSVQEIQVGEDGVYLVLNTAGGETVTVRLTERTRIRWGSETLTPNDFVPGDEVVVSLKNGEALQVRVVERVGQEAGQYLICRIEEISEDDGEVVLKVSDAEGETHTVRLAANVRVRFGSKKIDVDDLEAGDTVRLRFQYGLCVEVMVTAREAAGQ